MLCVRKSAISQNKLDQINQIGVLCVCTEICSKHHPGEGARGNDEKFRGGAIQEEALVLRVDRRRQCVNIYVLCVACVERERESCK